MKIGRPGYSHKHLGTMITLDPVSYGLSWVHSKQLVSTHSQADIYTHTHHGPGLDPPSVGAACG